MTLRIMHDSGHNIDYTTTVFSGGEVHFRLKPYPGRRPTSINIEAHLRSSQDIMTLIMATDALRREYRVPMYLRCPYVPYARQDRVCNRGEPLSISVMAAIINGLRFDGVQVWDAHSDVTGALLDNCENIPSSTFLSQVVNGNTILVSPDAGAIKKVSAAAMIYGVDMVRADKHRDTKTGAITETVVYSDHVVDRDFLIVDDICDGGRTFIELAKKLRPLTDGEVNLYVTHGIFSQGLAVFNGIIDNIYTPNAWPGHGPHRLLTHLRGLTE